MVKKKNWFWLIIVGILVAVLLWTVVLKRQSPLQKVQSPTAPAVKQSNQTTYAKLQQLNYQNQQQIVINHDQPDFTREEVTATKPWANYANLDRLNRAVKAEGLLNQSLMPRVKREPLYWNPTGWHNKQMPDGRFLYNRSHLIGYQFTGQNNNPKNLITGTASLNNPEMLVNEDDIAAYLKESPHNFVRYAVEPVYRGDELVPRGVWMRAESPDERIRFNRYIFNIQAGMQIDYQTGYSRVGNPSQNAASSSQSSNNQNQNPNQAPPNHQKIWGNTRSHVYHVPGQASYNTGNPNNRVWFDSEEQAQQAGYRKASN